MKTLFDISDKITEEEYRNDGKIHYSTLATYERSGFGGIATLFDKKESPSLTLGSCVDSIITGSMDEFNERFIVAEFPEVPDSIIPIVKALFNEFSITHDTLEKIPTEEIIEFASRFNYQNNWKPETRAKVIVEKGSEYYKLMHIAGDKTIISNATYSDVLATVDALKNSLATKWYFEENNPFDESIQRFYQLKFHSTFNGIDYSCMMDEVIVDNIKKIIYPIDLKTSSHTEYDFYKSFIDWSYAIQAREYARILKDNCERDDFFKDYKIMPYRFIVANKRTLNPLVWEFKDTFKYGTLYYGRNKQIECRDPFEIAAELKYYIEQRSIVPIGVNLSGENDIIEWLNKM